MERVGGGGGSVSGSWRDGTKRPEAHSTTDITDTELLVPRRAGGLGEVLQLAFLLLLLALERFRLRELGDRLVDLSLGP